MPAFTQPFTLTASSGTVTAPAIATNAGYHTLVWSDDFVTNDTIGPHNSTYTTNPHFRWWEGNQDHVTRGDCVIQTTWTAASTPLGTDAGNNASSAGGILVMNGSNPNNSGNGFIMSIPGFGLNAVPSGGNTQGAFNKVCIEAYLRYDPALRLNSGGDANGQLWFPAFWSWTVEGLNQYSGQYSFGPATSTEIDFLEDQAGVFGRGLTVPFHGGSFPGGFGTGSTKFAQANYTATDSGWHTYTFLWDQSNNVSFYKDGVQSGTAFQVPSVNPAWANQHVFITLGTGYQWPMYCDWVRAWGLP